MTNRNYSEKAVIDLSTNLQTAYPDHAVVHGVFINTATSNHVCLIKDGTTVAYRIPANATAGNYYAMHDVRFGTNIVVDPDDSATGEIVIEYQPLGLGT